MASTKLSHSSKPLTLYALNIAIVATLFVATAAAPVVNAGEFDLNRFGLEHNMAGSNCRGALGECTPEDEEFGLESESSRRILASSRYISYGALQRDSVPCSRRGASYYNCKPGASSNPYTRGCSKITRCRS